MFKAIPMAAVAAFVMFGPAYADDKAKQFCNDAHMKEMDGMVAGVSDAAKKKSAQEQLDLSKAAFKKGDEAGCVKHMEAAHRAMG